MADLFNTERCGLPQIPKLDFDFVDDCDITLAPSPFFDVPRPPEFLFEPPTLPTFAGTCPVFNIFADVTTNADFCVAPYAEITATNRVGKEGECLGTFDFNLVPAKMPCPVFSYRTTTHVENINAPTITTEFSASGECDEPFKLDFDFDIALPSYPFTPLDPQVFNIALDFGELPRFDIDNFDFTAEFPPIPCIPLDLDILTTTYGYMCEPITGNLNVIPLGFTSSSSATCEYLLDFDFQFPKQPFPCIEADGTVSVSYWDQRPKLEGTVINPDWCDIVEGSMVTSLDLARYQFDFQFWIPELPHIPPIPTFFGCFDIDARNNLDIVYDSDSSASLGEQDATIITASPEYVCIGNRCTSDSSSSSGESLAPVCGLDKLQIDFDFHIPAAKCPDSTVSTYINFIPFNQEDYLGATEEEYPVGDAHLEITDIGECQDCGYNFNLGVDLYYPVITEEFMYGADEEAPGEWAQCEVGRWIGTGGHPPDVEPRTDGYYAEILYRDRCCECP